MEHRHVVDELRFELTLGSEELAFDLHERLGTFAGRVAPEVIRDRLDARDPGDGVVRLDRLEIAIGHLHVDESDAVWGDRLRHALDQALDGAFAAAAADTWTSGGEPRSTVSTSRQTAGRVTPAVQVASDRAEFDVVWHQLHHGHLPWQAAHLGPDEWEALCRRVVERRGADLARAITASKRRAMLQARIRGQWPEDVVRRLGTLVTSAERAADGARPRALSTEAGRWADLPQRAQIESTQAEWASRLQQLIARLLDGDRRTGPGERARRLRAVLGEPLLREATPTSIWQAITEVALRLGVRAEDLFETRPTAVTPAAAHAVPHADRIPTRVDGTPSTMPDDAAKLRRVRRSPARIVEAISPGARHRWLSRLVTAQEAERWAQLPGLAALQWLTGKAPGDEAARQVEVAMLRELVAAHASASTRTQLTRRPQPTQIELTQAEWASRLQQLVARLLDGDRRTGSDERARRLREVLGKPLLREATPTSIWQAITAVALTHGVREEDVFETRTTPLAASRHEWLSRLVTAEEAERWAQLPGLAALQWLTGKTPGDEAARQVEAAMQRELVSVHASVTSRQQQAQIELTQTDWASRLKQLIARLLDGDQRPGPEERARRLRAVLREPLLRESTPTSIWKAITAVALDFGVREEDVLEARTTPLAASRYEWLSRLVTAEEAARWAQLPGLAALQWLTGRSPGDEAARQVEAVMQRELVSVHACVSSRQQQVLIELTQTEWASRLKQMIARLLDDDQRPSPEERTRRLRAVLGEPQLREATPRSIWQAITVVALNLGVREEDILETRTTPVAASRYEWLAPLVTAEEAERWAQLPGLAALQWLTGKALGDEAALRVEATMQRELESVHAGASTQQPRTQIELTQTEWSPHLQQLIARLLDDDQRPSPGERARRLRAVLEDPLLRETTPTSIWQTISAVALRLGGPGQEDATQAQAITAQEAARWAQLPGLPALQWLTGKAPGDEAARQVERAMLRELVSLPASTSSQISTSVNATHGPAHVDPMASEGTPHSMPRWRHTLHSAMMRATLAQAGSAWRLAMVEDRDWLRGELAMHGRSARWRWDFARELDTIQLTEIAGLLVGNGEQHQAMEFAVLARRPRPWLAARPGSLALMRHRLRAAVLDYLLVDRTSDFDLCDSVTSLLSRLAEQGGRSLQQLARKVQAASDSLAAHQALTPAIQAVLASLASIPQHGTQSDTRPETASVESADPWPWMAEPELDTTLVVPDAGIVLAGAFLPRLFDRTGLLDSKVFRDQSAACRAVHLLHYLGHGEREAPEPVLALDKLLCGLDLSVPVPRDLGLTDDECAAVDDLLQALIQHWGALGTTSIHGLREAFLQREGALVRGEQGWTLTVQARALDVLLDRLPWSIGTIKAPWMREVLHVQWR